MDALTRANNELTEQCQRLVGQLEEAHERNEAQKTEMVAWEAALKQASHV